MKRSISLLFLSIFFSSLACAQPVDIQRSKHGTIHENIEWCNIWISHANETNLPRVLLIGDSISEGYYHDVETNLVGKAYVGRLASSSFISDPILRKEITMVLDEYTFDVIHFNNGMHGWQHTEAEYQREFPEYLALIKSLAPHAKLIWATTTSLKISPQLPPNDLSGPTDERISSRNAIALKFIQSSGIDVDDLNTLCTGHPELHIDNVHFNEQGVALQASQVAAHIKKMLEP